MDHKKNDDLSLPAEGVAPSKQPKSESSPTSTTQMHHHNPALAAAYERTMRETRESRNVSPISRAVLLAIVALLLYYALQMQYHTRKATGRWDEYDWANDGTVGPNGEDANMLGFEQYIDGEYFPSSPDP